MAKSRRSRAVESGERSRNLPNYALSLPKNGVAPKQGDPVAPYIVPVTTAIRIAIGYMWYESTLWKLPPDWGCGPNGDRGLCDWMQRSVDNPFVPPLAELVKNFFLPNVSWFGATVWGSELLLGVFLALGLFVRPMALLGALYSINLLLLLKNVPHEWQWTYIFMSFIHVFLFLLQAGRPYGLDRWVGPRLAPRVPERLRWLF